jgi:hypothetical protein
MDKVVDVVFDHGQTMEPPRGRKVRRHALAASLDSKTALHELQIRQKREFVMQKQPDRRRFQNIALQ